jgi:O-antigen/teichoic acid export membrane protein
VPSPTIGRSDAVRVALASAVAAVSSYVVLALAARVLVPVENNTVFVTYWATLFACFGVLSGVSIETTRTVTAVTATVPGLPRRNPRVLTVGAVVGVLTTSVLGMSAPLWAPRLFPIHPVALGAAVSVGAGAYAVHSVIVGSLAGGRRWRLYARLIGAESGMRLALILVAAALGSAVLGFAWGAALAAFTWVAFLSASPTVRDAAAVRADSGWPTLARRLTASSGATGASAVMVVGFPMLLSITTDATQYKSAAPLLLAITLTRAPLMVPLNAYQGVAVSHFVEHRDAGLRAMTPVARAVVALGVGGAALAFAVGPWLMRLLLGQGYDVSGRTLAGLTLAATGLAFLTLTGALCQALTLHGVFVGGWVASLVVAIVVLMTPMTIEHRAVLALLVGPLVGIAIHLVALRRSSPRPGSVGDRPA